MEKNPGRPTAQWADGTRPTDFSHHLPAGVASQSPASQSISVTTSPWIQSWRKPDLLGFPRKRHHQSGLPPSVSQSSLSGDALLASLYIFLHVLFCVCVCVFLSPFKFFYLLKTLTC